MTTTGEMLDRIAEVCRDFGITSLDAHIGSCRSLSGRKGPIDLGVFGRFKAGKSSLLNSLAGADVLPVGVTPVTAVITYLRFAEAGRASVRFQDGREFESAPRDMPDHVSATRNPENARRVASVDISVPSCAGFSGLRFVDTPGLGSSLRDNTETAMTWLPRAEASLVVVNVDSPLSEQDIDLLRRLVAFTPNITVVLTKADLVSREQLQEVVDFVTTRLRKEFGRAIPLYPFSTKPGFEAVRQTFTDEVIRPLALRHELEAERLLGYKLGALLRSCIDYLEVARAAALKAQTGKGELRRKIFDERLNMDPIRAELRMLSRGMTEGLRDRFQKQVKVHLAPLAQKIDAEVSERLAGSRLNLYRLTQAYSEWVEAAFRSEIALISTAERAAFLAPLKEAEATFSRAAGAFRDRLASNVSCPHLWGIDLLWFLVPMSIFRGRVDRSLLDNIPFESWKNLSRLAFHWTRAIEAGIEGLHRSTDDYISRELVTVMDLLSRDEAGPDRAKAALAELKGLLAQSPVTDSNP